MPPSVTATPIAIVALCISVATLLLGLLAHIWTRRSYNRTGPQIVVELKPSIWLPGESLAQWQSPAGEIPPSDMSGPGVESALLVIENGGRTAVTISEPGIRFQGKRRRWPRFFLRERHAITPRMFDPESTSPETATKAPFRLDAYQTVSYLLDVHTVISAAKKARPDVKKIRLRGMVRIPGPRRYFMSKPWRVPRNAVTLVGYAPTTPASRLILRSLIVDPAPDLKAYDCEYVSRMIAAHLWAHRHEQYPAEFARAHSAVEFALDAVLHIKQPIVIESATWNISTLLEEHRDQLDWEAAERQWQLHQRARDSHEKRRQSHPPSEVEAPIQTPDSDDK